MAGLIEKLFGTGAAKFLDRPNPLQSDYMDNMGKDVRGGIVRGLNPVGTSAGFIDLSGVIAGQQDLPGGSKDMESRGFLQPAPTTVPGQIAEGLTGMIGGGTIMKGAGMAIGAARRGATGIRQTLGERTGDIKDLMTQAGLETKSKFIKQVNKFQRAQASDIKKAAENLIPPSSRLSDVKFAEKAKEGYSSFVEEQDKIYKAANAKDFDKALKFGNERVEIPGSQKAYDDLESWIINKASLKGEVNQDYYTELLQEAQRLTKEPISIGVMKDELQAGVKILNDPRAANAFDPKVKDALKQADEMFQKALKQRLEDAKGSVPQVDDLITARENFAARKAQRDQMLNEGLTKFFKLEDPKELTTSKIVDRLKTMDPKELDFFNNIISKNHMPELTQNLKAKLFEDMMSKGDVPGASNVGVAFDARKFLREYESMSPEMKKLVRPNNPQGDKVFDDFLGEVKGTLNSKDVKIQAKGGVSKDASLAAEGIAASTLGITTAAPRGFFQGIGELVTNRDAVFNRIYRMEPFGGSAGFAGGAASAAGRAIATGQEETRRLEAAQGSASVPEVSAPQQAPTSSMAPPSSPSQALPDTGQTSQSFTLDQEDMQSIDEVMASSQSAPTSGGLTLDAEDMQMIDRSLQGYGSENAMRQRVNEPMYQGAGPPEGMDPQVYQGQLNDARSKALEDEINRYPPGHPTRMELERLR